MNDLTVLYQNNGLTPKDVVFSQTGDAMRIPFPEEHYRKLESLDPENETGFLNPDVSYMGCASITDLGKRPRINDLNDIIRTESLRSAEQFLSFIEKAKQNNSRLPFNGASQGVSSFHPINGQLIINTHASNFFTNRTLNKVYAQLVKGGQISLDTIREGFLATANPLAFLFSSFGANISVISTGTNGSKNYILGSRPNGARHVSANEGINAHEVEGATLHDLCVRGMKEELGIDQSDLNQMAINAQARELFLVPSLGQVGMHARFDFEMTANDIINRKHGAKDSWENPTMSAIPLTSEGIKPYTRDDANTIGYSKKLIGRLIYT